MIELPDFARAFDYENDFYLSCDIKRISKIISHYELFKMAQTIPGAIVDCGVFKGASFVRWAMFRKLSGNAFAKKIIGFDTFDTYPETQFDADKKKRESFVAAAGRESITKEQLIAVLAHKGITEGIELIEGDICQTVPQYVAQHPELKISILNLDTDIYEPAVTILESLFPRLMKGGILLIDDYGVFPGETQAVDEFLRDKQYTIQKLPFSMTPAYIIK